MFKGNQVLLRPMQPEDIARQHEFNQDPELYGLDCDYLRVSPLERARALYETRTTKPDENTAFFAIEADGKYIGNCGLIDLHNRHGNLELDIMICDRAY